MYEHPIKRAGLSFNRILSFTVTGTVFPDEAEFEETVELGEGAETSFERYFEMYQR